MATITRSTRPGARTLRSSGGDFANSDDVGEDRAQIVWRRKWFILLLAIIIGGFSAAFAMQSPVVYSAQATVRVSLLQTRDIGAQNAIAANEFAAQYAQIANSDPVLESASGASETSVAVLRAHIQASPLNKYNVVGITATAPDSRAAARRADAVADALVKYVNSSYRAALSSASKASAAQLSSLDDAIARAQSDATKATQSTAADGTAAASAASARSLLSSLIALKQNLYLAPLNELSQARPVLTALDAPRSGEKQSQHVPAYAGIGFVAGLVVAAQFFILTSQARSRRRR